MDKRTLYSRLLIAILIFGAIAISSIFSDSLEPSHKAENTATMFVTASVINSAQLNKVDSFYIVTDADDQGDILVFEGWAPKRRCSIEFIPATKEKYHWGVRKQFNNTAHFYEACEGSIWTLDGKLVPNTGHPEEMDMVRKNYTLNAKGDFTFHKVLNSKV